jgi:hypothetical protein
MTKNLTQAIGILIQQIKFCLKNLKIDLAMQNDPSHNLNTQ